MLYKNEDSFSKAFKAATSAEAASAEAGPSGLYFLYGSENYLIDAWAARIIKKVCGKPDAFNFQKLDGRKPDLDMLIDATEALPLMAGSNRCGGSKCVLLDDIDASKLNAEQLKRLEELFSDINPACVLVVAAKPPVFDMTAANAKKLIKLAEAHGTAVELGSRGPAGLAAFIKAEAKKHGCEASPDVCRYILQTCENDMLTLKSETAKICAYANGVCAGGGELARAHVDAVASPKIEARVFDLSKAILAGNAQRAMEILANLFYLREQPVSILAALIMSYVDLYRARIARDEGKNAAQVMKMFGYRSEYRVNNAFSGRLSAGRLRECLIRLYECDLKMKSTGIDDKVLLEQTVTRLLEAGI